ncbi:MAG: trigger factor [Candidatus Marinimicrobia bacterium]|nr:trigger factor [Candidatus Neomarinimicrobiota bacterium]
MHNELTDINTFTRRLTVEVPWEELEDEYRAFLQKFTRKIKLPGFRRGKVPPRIVRRQYGNLAEAEFAEGIVQEYYQTSVADSGREPISQATIRGVHFHEGEALRFEATFEVEPEVSLPAYHKGMKFQQIFIDSDDEDVSRAIEEFRLQQAQLQTVEGGIEEDHFVMLDLQEVDENGTPIIGRKMENQNVHLSPNGPFGGENLASLRGARVGDIRRVILTDESGTPTNFEVTVRQVSKRLLPDIDDIFAREADAKADNVDQLKENVNRRIRASFERQGNKNLTHEIADHFVRNAQLEVPTSMFDNYIDNLIADMEREGHEGASMERTEVVERHKASVIWNIKWYLLRKRLIKEEEITVDDAAVEQRIEELAAQDEDQAQQIKNFYRRPENRRTLREDILSDKLFEKLKSYAKIKIIHKPSSELRKVS